MRRSLVVQPTRRVYSYASPVNTRRDLFIATFGILALELAIIRWVSQQVRVFAYLNNVLLMAAFLGMGLGVAMGSAPVYPYSRSWGYYPSGTLGTILLIVLILYLLHYV